MRAIIFSLVLATFLAGCAHRRFQDEEAEFGTDGPITSLYHASVYYPQEVAPRIDGYIVGIEKVNRNVLGESDRSLVDANEFRARSGPKKWASRLSDNKLMMITHILKTNKDVTTQPNSFIYNAYADDRAVPRHVLSQADCDVLARSSLLCAKERMYTNSWEALDIFQGDLSRELKNQSKGYTHIVVVIMGWNTVQEEGVRNVSSIALNLMSQHAADARDAPPFRPLVIGVTWPSEWNSEWLDPVLKITSFPTKADDADEVGMTWLAVLLHKSIPGAVKQANSSAKTVVIGHSFGSRAASVAVCQGVGIGRTLDAPLIPRGQVAALVNFQGAFMTKRLLGTESSAPEFEGRCDSAEKILLTSSRHDKAVTAAIWGKLFGRYAGDSASYAEYCGRTEHDINCGIANSDGRLIDESTHASTLSRAKSRIFYVNSDALISENAYQTGGGAHSDIFRKEHAKLTLDFLNDFKELKGSTSSGAK